MMWEKGLLGYGQEFNIDETKVQDGWQITRTTARVDSSD
jgi:hypothetical protein